MNKEEYERIGNIVVQCAIEVHRNLGPGLLESVYEYCLVAELRKRQLKVQSQVQLPIIYKGEKLEKTFIIDVLVENIIVLELKSVESLFKINDIQLLTYLKLGDYKLGYLLNFNVPIMRDGIRRKVNNYFI